MAPPLVIAASLFGSFLTGANFAYGTAPTAVISSYACLQAINTYRSSKIHLSTPLPPLEIDPDLEATAASQVGALAGTAISACTQTVTNDAVEKAGIVLRFNHNIVFECPKLLASVVAPGLEPSLDLTKTPFSETAAPYNKQSIQNFSHLFFQSATAFGCAHTRGCTTGTNALLCVFKKNDKVAPLTKPYYEAIKKRNETVPDLTVLLAASSAASSAVFSVPALVLTLAATLYLR